MAAVCNLQSAILVTFCVHRPLLQMVTQEIFSQICVDLHLINQYAAVFMNSCCLLIVFCT